MNYKCDVVIVCCMDFRFQKYIRLWQEKELKGKTYDYVSFAGCTKNLPTILK